jgi:hypothetical protein
MNDQYDRLRKEVLRSHPWNFSIAYVALAQLAGTPIWTDWTYQYTIPSDVLRVLETNLTDDEPWEIGVSSGGTKVIFSSASAITIKYIKDVTNTTTFDPVFEEALAFRLAADSAYSIVQSQTVQANMFTAYQQSLAQARSFDGQESQPKQQVQADEFINIRG